MEIARHWRTKDQRMHLGGAAICENGHPVFPPRPVCTECHGITTIHPNFKHVTIFEAPIAISLPREVPVSSG